jgi:uncharacterized protein (DUF885 family)
MLGGAYRKTSLASTKANHMFFPGCRLRFGAAAAAMAGALAAGCTPTVERADPLLAELVQRFGASEIQRRPEHADMIGLPDSAFGRSYAALLNDRSMADEERARTRRLEFLADFERIDRALLSPAAIRSYDSLRATLEATVAVDRHGHGVTSLGRTSPYVITFADGAFTNLVEFLTLHVTLSTPAEAGAWLERLEQMDEAMRDERRRFEVDLEAGTIPPRSVAQRTLDKVRQLRPGIAREHVLVQHFTESLAQVADIPEADIARLTARAAELVGGDIKEEYDALIALLEATLAKAPAEPGVWHLKAGEAYYVDALRLHTTSSLTPAQMNELGVKLVEQINKELDPLLASAGLTEGSVGARLRTLAQRPEFLFPETPEGRLALLDAINQKATWATGIAARVVAIDKLAPLVVREAPRVVQDTTSKAYYRPGSLNGSRPGTYNITLQATADFPAWTLPTLTFHEGIPGHHLQIELERDLPNQPVIEHLVAYPAFDEGWATYAEDLALELGAYQLDPIGRIGYLQSQLLHAARLVTDTGIHAQRWTREEAVGYLEETAGIPRTTAEIDVDRSAIRPGVAAAYMTGRETILRLRGQAQRELQTAFDLKAFHAALLGPGPRTMAVVEADIATFIAGQKNTRPSE